MTVTKSTMGLKGAVRQLGTWLWHHRWSRFMVAPPRSAQVTKVCALSDLVSPLIPGFWWWRVEQ